MSALLTWCVAISLAYMYIYMYVHMYRMCVLLCVCVCVCELIFLSAAGKCSWGNSCRFLHADPNTYRPGTAYSYPHGTCTIVLPVIFEHYNLIFKDDSVIICLVSAFRRRCEKALWR